MRPRYALLAAADAVLAARGHRRARRLTTPLLLPSLAARRGAPTRRALLLGGVGDVALLGEGRTAFAVGLGSFLLGHVAWVAALRRRPAISRTSGPAPPTARARTAVAVVLVGANALLWWRTGTARLPVLVCPTALTATALASLDTGDVRVGAGAAGGPRVASSRRAHGRTTGPARPQPWCSNTCSSTIGA